MSLTYVTTVPLKGLAIPFLSVCLAVLFELSLQLTALLTLSLSLGISLILPSIAFSLVIAANLILQFTFALSLSLPSLVLDLGINLSIELVLVLSLIAALEALLDCSLCAYGWFGPGSGLGPAVTTAVGTTWPDGVDAETDIVAFVFAATIPGPIPADSVASISLVEPPPPAPAPSNPPLPPAAPYPPPQVYTAGLARAVVAPPPEGGQTATASVSVDSSVATGIGAVTGVSVGDPGHGYTSPPAVSITDAAPIVSATTATPIVITLPDALTVPALGAFGGTVSGVLGDLVVRGATSTTPIVVTLDDTTGIETVQIQPGTYGIQGLNGTWYLKALDGTHAELWANAEFTMPSSGQGTYTQDSATFAANINGGVNVQVLTPTTVALYRDADFLVPVAGIGSYTGGTLAGAGQGAVVNATLGGGALQTMRLFFGGIPFPTVSGNLAGGSTRLSIALGGVFPLIGDLLTELRGRANALAGITANIGIIPPSITASLELLGKIVANLTANLNVTLPDLSISASAALSAQIEVIADLVARIGLYVGLDGDLLVYKYEGPGSGLGAAIAAGPGAVGWNDGTSASTPVVAGVFGLTTPAAAAAFSVFFPVAA